MSGTHGRSRSGNRFYNPPAVRRQMQLQQEQQQQQQQKLVLQQKLQYKEKAAEDKDEQPQQRGQSAVSNPRTRSYAAAAAAAAAASENRAESDDGTSSASTAGGRPSSAASSSSSTFSKQQQQQPRPPPASAAPAAAGSSPACVSHLSNLDRFLEHTTPLVPVQHFPKTSTRRWRTQEEDDLQPYFVLGDLWDSFKEWSAYGAGVPLLLNGSDSVIQYYVPYLSGIQLYVDPSVPPLETRRFGEESDAESSRGSSDGSSDCEAERRPDHFFRDLIEVNGQRIQRLSLRNNANSKPLNGSSSDEGDSSSFPGTLTFQYFEYAPPHNREPLADKISLLATRFPELKSRRSCDLAPASWMSVAWYPIYRIPTGQTLQNLDSCFLTFHSLSTPINGKQSEWQNPCVSQLKEVRNNYGVTSLKLPLRIFGLATYKFKTAFWDHNNAVERCPKADIMWQTADDFLRHLNVDFHDYSFFKRWRR